MTVEVLAIGFDSPEDRDRLRAAADARFRIAFTPRAMTAIRQPRMERPRLCLINGTREGDGDAASEIRRWCRYSPEVKQVVMVFPRPGAARIARVAANLQRPVFCVHSAEAIVDVVVEALEKLAGG